MSRVYSIVATLVVLLAIPLTAWASGPGGISYLYPTLIGQAAAIVFTLIIWVITYLSGNPPYKPANANAILLPLTAITFMLILSLSKYYAHVYTNSYTYLTMALSSFSASALVITDSMLIYDLITTLRNSSAR